MNVWASVLLALAIGPAVAQAQESAPATPCAQMDAALPADLAAWTDKAALTSATGAEGLPAATLSPGQAVRLALHHTRAVHYPVEPDKPGGKVAYGGLLGLRIDQGGDYRIALGSGAWIDIVAGQDKIASIAHGRGPQCSTIRKSVGFKLAPGRYVVQISANAEPTLALMVSRQP